MTDEKTYKIRRHYHPDTGKENHDVEGMDGLTLQEAQDHCNDPDTSVPGQYFDGYYEE